MTRFVLVLLSLAGCEERPPQQPLPDDIESTWGLRPAAPTDTGVPGEIEREPEPDCEEEPCVAPHS